MFQTGQRCDAEMVREELVSHVGQSRRVRGPNQRMQHPNIRLSYYFHGKHQLYEGMSIAITICQVAGHMEMLARQKEDEMWSRGLQESLYADRKAVIETFAAPNFVQWVTESGPSTNNQNDIRKISMMMQGVRQ